ncbi:MAG: rRNA maturation RNase YbeY [Patescibacteria group bacterium]|jgi:probable rRNA maturation factor|nr:rRNA maturation RNase YbeY [Patescibacteria group bacterium]
MIEVNNKTQYKFCRRRLKRLFISFCEMFSLNDGEVSLVVIGDKRMKDLNKQHRKLDKTTDVLTFPLSEKGLKYLKHNYFWGEIFINISEIKRIAKYDEMFKEINMKTSHSKTRQNYLFYFLIAHGLLHITGYTDETEKQRLQMLKIGKELLEKADIK